MKTPFRKWATALILCFLAVALVAIPASAQQEEYRLSLHRDFGYEIGSQIRGNFTVSIAGVLDFRSVTYYIDGQEMAVVTETPYKFRFQTSDYPSGWHELSAVVEKNTGEKVTTPTRRFQFASKEEQTSGMAKLILPILGLLLVMTLLGSASQMRQSKNQPNGQAATGSRRTYGFLGGAICPKCGRPTSLQFGGINLPGMRFNRCENCGRWSWMHRAREEELRRAEAAEMKAEEAVAVVKDSEEERVKKLMDDSKYMDR